MVCPQVSLDEHHDYIVKLFFKKKQSLVIAQYLKNDFDINVTDHIIKQHLHKQDVYKNHKTCDIKELEIYITNLFFRSYYSDKVILYKLNKKNFVIIYYKSSYKLDLNLISLKRYL